MCMSTFVCDCCTKEFKNTHWNNHMRENVVLINIVIENFNFVIFVFYLGVYSFFYGWSRENIVVERD